MKNFYRILVVCLIGIATLGAATDEPRLPQQFSAVAIGTGGLYSDAVAAQVVLTISRWSNEDERKRLFDTLRDEGQRSMLNQLQDLKPVGTIRVNDQLAYDLRFAEESKGEDGRRSIVLATDRPVSAWEAINQPRYSEYPFTFIEMHVDKDGRGSGKIAPFARLTSSEDGRFLFLENYDSQPVQLNDIKRIR